MPGRLDFLKNIKLALIRREWYFIIVFLMHFLSLVNFTKRLNVDYDSIDQFYEDYISNTESIAEIRKLWLQSIAYNFWYFDTTSITAANFIKIIFTMYTRIIYTYSILLQSFIAGTFTKTHLGSNSPKKSSYTLVTLAYNKLNFFIKNSIYFYISSFYNGFKNIFLPILLTSVILLVIIDFYNINFTRQVGIWFVIGILFFWLISGFNFFIKRYKYGKFTGAIQRFWKRTNSYFWIVEGFLFSLFFYYYLNSSQDVLYFVDEANLNQTFVTNLSSFYFSALLLLFLIFYSLFLLLNLPNFSFKQQVLHLTLITVFFLYGFLLETYQFYYVIAGFFELVWDFSEETNVWSVDTVSPWVRVKNQYLTLALIAKYWHFLFIFISWLFMVFKFYENKKVSYTLIGINIQNYMLLFLLNILFNANWLKWLARRYYDESYYWFFTDFNYWTSKTFIDEFFLFFSNFSII